MTEDSGDAFVPAHNEEEWNQEMEKVEASPLAMAKKVFVLAKTSFVIY